MDKSKKPILDEFGSLLMGEVRDHAFWQLEHLLTGQAAAPSWKELFARYEKLKLNPEQAKIVKELLVLAVDLVRVSQISGRTATAPAA